MQQDQPATHGVRPERKLPPGPRAYPLVGNTLEVQRDAPGFYRWLAREYGDIVSYRFMRWPSILVNHPDYIKHILQENYRNYSKNVFNYRMLVWFVGLGLLTGEGDSWLHSRRLMQQAFHRQRIVAFGAMMTANTGAMIERWQPAIENGRPLQMDEEMMRLTLANVSEALFSINISDEAGAIGRAFALVNGHYGDYVATLLFPPHIPLPRNRRFRAALAQLDQFVYSLIRERRHRNDKHDLLAMLLDARDEETGLGMDDTQLRHEIMTLLFAGHETTANALTWTWYLLAQYPDAEARLQAELDKVLGGRAPVVEDLVNLPYTRMVLDETLRLYPPVWFIPRRVVEDDEMGGYIIPKNSMIHFSPYVVHRHPAFWEEPDTFDPERFAPERAAGRLRFAYCPFGGGPRLCIGNAFALMEAQIVLATVAQRFRFSLVPGKKVTLLPQITLSPRNGLRMTVVPR